MGSSWFFKPSSIILFNRTRKQDKDKQQGWSFTPVGSSPPDDDLSFDASERGGSNVHVDARYVKDRLEDIVEREDLSRYVL